MYVGFLLTTVAMRTAVFVDAGYLYKIVKLYYGGRRIAYEKLASEVTRQSSGGNLLRVYFYDCLPYQSNPPTSSEREMYSKRLKFFESVGKLPRFEIRQGRLQRSVADGKTTFTQKQVDVLLSVDLVELAATRQIADAVLIAGDSDFVPAVRAAKTYGVVVHLWHGPGPDGGVSTVHNELWSTCDERHEFDQSLIDRVSM